MNKYTVTIGIPAHNEEANIGYLLESILQQKGDFVIDKIRVFADGCSDQTESIVSELAKKNPLIELVSDGKRRGKPSRLNILHQENQSDIVINFDADIILADSNVIAKMLQYFQEPEVAVVCANNQPLKGKSFIEKITNAGDLLWYQIRKEFNDGNNIYNCSGCATAMKKRFAKNFVLDKDVVADQQMVYITLYQRGEKMAYAQDAVVYYRTPSTLKDFFNQAGRSLVEKYYLPEFQDPEIQALYYVPFSSKVVGVVKSLLKNPMYSSLAIVFQVMLRLQSFKWKDSKNETQWEMVTSTKKLF
jgi:cellulose synthase/poly-beta-1,6-N-acetylglucosamine synthase-like glycosyltransferase